MTIKGNRDYTRVLLYSYYTTITGWGDPPKVSLSPDEPLKARRRISEASASNRNKKNVAVCSLSGTFRRKFVTAVGIGIMKKKKGRKNASHIDNSNNK